ncbi:MAG: hypothetical protein LWW96_05330 [Acidovorax sp.]|uniref:surface-adhesin E family protein n=1 Tax=Acidovorax sp. TaxID=1872122 RepID=UPI0025B8F046|nr:surface-adhesin E family protein [Acidovorax sp.]MCE1191559.1 hypothetical protein [Acidovorax sp.]
MTSDRRPAWIIRLRAGAAALVCAAAACNALAGESMWLTVVGDSGDAAVDTVEVDATSAVAFESMRLVKLRVNRAKPRTGFDGQPYRSYYSTAVVDCTELKSWHRTLSLFEQPLWRGKLRIVEYTERDGREVAFADMEANPRDRLIKAACSIALRGG